MQENEPCKVPILLGAKPKLFAFFGESLTQTLRIMKLTAIFLLAAAIQISAKGIGQEKITISVNNTSLEQVFNSIEKQSGFHFIYWDESIAYKKVSVVIKNASLRETLERCFKGLKLSYNIVGKSVVVNPAENSSVDMNGQNPVSPIIDVRGRVVNENEEPVPEVTVTIKGTQRSTKTNSNGEFSLATIEQDATLVFTHISMESFELKVSGRAELTIRLKTKVAALGDVQVIANTGYQAVKPNEVTGSLNVLSAKTLNQQVGINILDRLRGVSSSILFPNQDLQGAPQIMVRGLSTINGPKSPLIVLDNFPYEGNITNINANDIESVTILKDASAASIWGVSAGNGVIVITTKKGRYNQPLQISVNANVISTNRPNLTNLETISSSDYIDIEQLLFNKGYYDAMLNNTSNRPAVSPVVEILAKQRAGQITSSDAQIQIDNYRNIDIRDQFSEFIYKKATTQQYSVNLQGGNNNFTYFLSGGYDKNLNNLSAEFNRYTFRSQNAFKPTKNLEIKFGLQYTQTNGKSGKPDFGTINVNNMRIPYLLLADEYGNSLTVDKELRGAYSDTVGRGKLLDWKYYPLNDWLHQRAKNSQQDVLGNIDVTYTLPLGFSLDAKYRYEKQTLNVQSLSDMESYYTRNLINRFTQLNRTTGQVKYIVPLGGIIRLSNTVLESQNIRGQINYNRIFGEHKINAFAGTEIRQTSTIGNSNTYFGYDNNTLTTTNIDLVNSYPTIINGSNSAVPNPGNSIEEKLNRFISTFVNAAYTFKERYILSGSGRKDASNLFGVTSNNKWNLLWSGGIGWIISNESFFKFNWLPYLKFRATYGFGGNTDPGRTALLTFRQTNVGDPTNYNISIVNNLPNPELRWEKIRTTNIGLDFQSKGDIINGSIEFYSKKGIDLYGPQPQDPTLGLALQSVIIKNVANMKGEGVDLTLNARIINASFKWNATAIYSYNSSKTSQYFLDTALRSGSYISSGNKISPMPDKPIYSIIALKWAGLDVNGNPQGYFNKNLSTDYASIYNKTLKEDLVYKPALPTHFGSFINTLGFKDINLTVCINYRLGYYFMKPSLSYSQLFTNGAVIGSNDFSKRWQNPGDENNTNVPSFVYPANNNRDAFYTSSEVNIIKADNIKIQYVNLSYDLSKRKYNWLPGKNIQLYANASNLGMLWKANKEGIDPDYISSPVLGKTYAVGIRATF